MTIKPSDSNENSTSEVWGAEGKNGSFSYSDYDEIPRRHQKGQKSKPERAAGTIGEGENGITATIDRGGDTKKLARQLELIKKAFNDYVGAHRGRLEQRLDENKQFTQIFEERLAQLEQEILGSPDNSKEIEKYTEE